MHDQKKAYRYALATVLCWSTVASAFKLSLRHLDHVQLLLWATLFSLLTLGAVLALRDGPGQVLRALRLGRGDLLRSAVYGFLNPYLYYLILFKAYDLLPAQEAQPLNYTWAITLTLLSIPLLGQRVAARDLLAILVSYVGVVVISTRGDVLGMRFSSGPGAALALASTVVWALYWILNTKDRREPVAGLFLNFAFGLAYILPTAALTSGFGSDLRGIAGAAYVGVFEMGLTFVMWLQALKLSRTTAQVGNLIFLSPFLSLVLIHFTVGEAILPSTVTGLGLIIVGNLVQRLGRK